MKLKNWESAICIISILIMILVTLGSVSFGAEKELGTKWNPIKIGTLFYYGFMPSHKAIEFLNEKKIFAAAYEFPSAVERLEALAGGYLHLSYAGLTASIMLSAAGKDVVVVCSVDEGGRAIIAKKEIKSFKDLVGKKVGTIFGSIDHISLLGELLIAGVNLREVNIINFPSMQDLPLAFASGGIDAYCIGEPVVRLGVTKFGGHILGYPYNSPMGKIEAGLETTRDFINKYPEQTYQVVKAHVEAVEYYNKNRDEALSEAIRRYKIPKEIAEESIKNTLLTYNIDIENMKALGKFLKDLGYIKTYPDWDKLIDLRFLERAKRELGLK